MAKVNGQIWLKNDTKQLKYKLDGLVRSVVPENVYEKPAGDPLSVGTAVSFNSDGKLRYTNPNIDRKSLGIILAIDDDGVSCTVQSKGFITIEDTYNFFSGYDPSKENIIYLYHISNITAPYVGYTLSREQAELGSINVIEIGTIQSIADNTGPYTKYNINISLEGDGRGPVGITSLEYTLGEALPVSAIPIPIALKNDGKVYTGKWDPVNPSDELSNIVGFYLPSTAKNIGDNIIIKTTGRISYPGLLIGPKFLSTTAGAIVDNSDLNWSVKVGTCSGDDYLDINIERTKLNETAIPLAGIKKTVGGTVDSTHGFVACDGSAISSLASIPSEKTALELVFGVGGNIPNQTGYEIKITYAYDLTEAKQPTIKKFKSNGIVVGDLTSNYEMTHNLFNSNITNQLTGDFNDLIFKAYGTHSSKEYDVTDQLTFKNGSTKNSVLISRKNTYISILENTTSIQLDNTDAIEIKVYHAENYYLYDGNELARAIMEPVETEAELKAIVGMTDDILVNCRDKGVYSYSSTINPVFTSEEQIGNINSLGSVTQYMSAFVLEGSLADETDFHGAIYKYTASDNYYVRRLNYGAPDITSVASLSGNGLLWPKTDLAGGGVYFWDSSDGTGSIKKWTGGSNFTTMQSAATLSGFGFTEESFKILQIANGFYYMALNDFTDPTKIKFAKWPLNFTSPSELVYLTGLCEPGNSLEPVTFAVLSNAKIVYKTQVATSGTTQYKTVSISNGGTATDVDIPGLSHYLSSTTQPEILGISNKQFIFADEDSMYGYDLDTDLKTVVAERAFIDKGMILMNYSGEYYTTYTFSGVNQVQNRIFGPKVPSDSGTGEWVQVASKDYPTRLDALETMDLSGHIAKNGGDVNGTQHVSQANIDKLVALPKTTVSTTSPGGPASGDIWIEI